MEVKTKISVAIYACEHDLKEALRFLLGSQSEFNLFTCHSTFTKFNEIVKSSVPNVVLMCLELKNSNAIEYLKIIRRSATGSKLLVLTTSSHKEDILAAVKAGVDGYLLKDISALKLIEAIKEVVEGGAPMSPEISRKAIELCASLSESSPLVNKGDLTSRELEVLRFLINGLSYKLVSDQLNISIDTTRGHIKNLYRKLKVNSKTEAVAKVLRNKILI